MDEREAADLIWQNWQEGTVIDDLPPALKPAGRSAGYAIQRHLERHSSDPRAGWKIAATSEAGQRHINVDGPLAGRILAEKIHPPGATISIGTNRMRVAEPEFAFRLALDLPAGSGPVTREAAVAAVDTLHLAIELPDSRFSDFTAVGGPTLIADNACARELVVGPPVSADWRALDLSAHAVHATVGDRYERDGVGSNVLGDPRDALAWCLTELGRLGIDLAAGEIITTGTCVPPLEIEPGDRVLADFGPLGTIDVEIAP